jgi:hypothetical protein
MPGSHDRRRSRSGSRRPNSRGRSRSRRSRTPSPPPYGPQLPPGGVTRSRSRSDRLERSVSRELYREVGEPKRELKELRHIVENQQDFLVDLFNDHKAKVEEKLACKARRFSSKQLEKQYQVNLSFRDLVAKIQDAHQAKEWKLAKRTAEELADLLEEHEQDLIIADISPHGWLAVNKLRNTSDLPKALRKRLATVEKDLEAQKSKNGGHRKKLFAVSGTGQDSTGRKTDRKFSPEEALSVATKQIRTGTCSHCHKEYHFYRECPVFWSKVQEGREAKAKGASSGN